MVLHSKNGLRLVAVGALVLGAAVSANAWIITLAGPVTGGALGLTYEFSDLLTGPFSAATTSNATLTSGTFTATSGTQSLSVNWAGTTVMSGNTMSLDGTWALVSETNLNVATTGTYSASLDNLDTNGVYEWSWVGTTTPEPAPFAAMGIGIIGLCVSRRRKLRN